jgi:hypothetical protein
MYEAGMADLIWVVIIVGSILSEILKNRKKAADKDASRKRGIPGGDPPTVDAGKELREFLETLSGGSPGNKPVQPPVKPPPARPVVRNVPPSHRKKAPLPPQVTLKHRPLPEVSPAELHSRQDVPSAAPQVRSAVTEAESDSPSTKEKHSSSELIRADLLKPDSARRAVVLREILGPPMALR